MRIDDYEVFLKKFEPVMSSNDPESLRLYHWEGKDLKELQKIKEEKGCINYFWTMLDCDGKIYIAPGLHRVNRMDYIVTQKPWKDGQRDYRY